MKITRRLMPWILCAFIGALLTSCAGVKTQKAILYLDDSTTKGRPISGNLKFYGSDKKPVAQELIEKAIKATSVSKKSEKTEWNENCNDGEGCVYLKNKPLSEIEVADFFEKDEGLPIELPVNAAGKAVLRIEDGAYSAEWRFTIASEAQPIYANLLITDFWVSLTELKDGKVTYTPVGVSALTPANSWYFEELYKEELPYYFERGNPWAQFRLMYTKYTTATSKADEETCKVFGKDCKGRASYSKIAKAYKAAYEDILTPMLNELSTSNEDNKVSVALLKLEKMAKLHVNCYFRTYSSADDQNEDAYSATSQCFSDVRQQESDLEIYLKENSQELTSFMRAGYH